MSAYPSSLLKSLADLTPENPYFVGIDSDGCMFDTMEIKQKECFCPNTIKHWELQPVARYAREAVEYVGLYSKWRSINRWPGLVMIFDLLRERAEVIARKAFIPDGRLIHEFIDSGFALTDDGLRAYMSTHQHPDLERALAWTTEINQSVSEMVHGIPPFPYAKESLVKLAAHADIMGMSSAPLAAVQEEWQEHAIARYTRILSGQEMGKKEHQITLATRGKYVPRHVLMVGDAYNDYTAARATKSLFYPINPGHEIESWQRFYDEAIDKFINDAYTDEYEDALVAEFVNLLPDVPPWKK